MSTNPHRSRRTDAPGCAPEPAVIRTLRDAAGLTQTVAGARVGVSLRTWQGWEAGEVAMHPATWRYAQAVFSGVAEQWLERTHPGGWIHGGKHRLPWEQQQLLLDAYRAGRMAR